MPIKPSHHHIEETDAGLDRPLYPRNKLYDETLKSQNYCANIQPFTRPFPLELLGRVAVYAVPVSRYRPSSRLASEPRTCLQATHLAHDNSAVVCRLRQILIVRLFSTVTKRGRAKIGPILLTLLARYAAGSMKRYGVRPSVCLSHQHGPQHQTPRQQTLPMLARPMGDIDPQRWAPSINAGSVMLRSEVQGSTQTCLYAL